MSINRQFVFFIAICVVSSVGISNAQPPQSHSSRRQSEEPQKSTSRRTIKVTKTVTSPNPDPNVWQTATAKRLSEKNVDSLKSPGIVDTSGDKNQAPTAASNIRVTAVRLGDQPQAPATTGQGFSTTLTDQAKRFAAAKPSTPVPATKDRRPMKSGFYPQIQMPSVVHQDGTDQAESMPRGQSSRRAQLAASNQSPAPTTSLTKPALGEDEQPSVVSTEAPRQLLAPLEKPFELKPMEMASIPGAIRRLPQPAQPDPGQTAHLKPQPAQLADIEKAAKSPLQPRDEQERVSTDTQVATEQSSATMESLKRAPAFRLSDEQAKTQLNGEKPHVAGQPLNKSLLKAKPELLHERPVTPGAATAKATHNLSDGGLAQAQAVVPERLARLPAQPANSFASPVGTGPAKKKLADFTFKDPRQFLLTDSLSFKDANQFLKPSTDEPQRSAVPSFLANQSKHRQADERPITRLPSASTSNVPIHRAVTRVPEARRTPFHHFGDSEEEDRYLTVSDVDQPIGEVPFADIAQQDTFNLLAQDRLPEKPFAMSNTFAEFTGQPQRLHIATYRAHHFKHRPLYFEEVNLERYGNQLPFQNFASAAHFFTSAAFLPYKVGATPPSCCITTLGHRRPGDCVPYRIHKHPRSLRGLIYQGLAVTAISL